MWIVISLACLRTSLGIQCCQLASCHVTISNNSGIEYFICTLCIKDPCWCSIKALDTRTMSAQYKCKTPTNLSSISDNNGWLLTKHWPPSYASHLHKHQRCHMIRTHKLTSYKTSWSPWRSSRTAEFTGSPSLWELTVLWKLLKIRKLYCDFLISC